jgi:hypothetical protein
METFFKLANAPREAAAAVRDTINRGSVFGEGTYGIGLWKMPGTKWVWQLAVWLAV